MTRHAKNNTALGFFTRGEKQKLGTSYGRVTVRLGAESTKDFDACCICLKQAHQIMCCTKGHIFCRSCILEALAAQQEMYNQQLQDFEDQKLRKQKEIKVKEEEKLVEEIEKFDKLESTVVPASPKAPKTNLLLAKTDAGDVGSLATEERKTKTAEVNERDTHLPCFWIPQLIPVAPEKEIEKPKLRTICPEGQHPLRLKHLKSVKFTLIDTDTEKKKSYKSGRYMCPSCRKTLTNATKSTVLRKCGHVFCQKCTKTLVKKEKSCVECGKPTKSKDMVALQVGGTGFSGHGTQMEATKYGYAFH